MGRNMNPGKRAGTLVTALLCVLGSAPAPVSGGGVALVYDPSNHVENITQALQALRQNVLSEAQLAQEVITAVNTVRQYEQMLKDYKVKISSLQGMAPAQILGLAKSLGGEVAVYADLADRLSRTDRNLRGVLDMYYEIERIGNFTSMTPSQIWWQERHRRRQENSYTRDRFNNIQRTLRSVQGDIQKINQLAAAIPDAGGAEGEKSLRQGLEIVATHLNVIAGQNTQLLALFAEESAAKSASALSQRTIKEAQDYNEYLKEWQEQFRIRQRYQQTREAARALWNSIPAR